MSIDFLDIASCINVLTNSTGQTVTTTETISAVYATVLYIFVVVCGCLHCRCGSFVANGSAAHADLRRRISDTDCLHFGAQFNCFGAQVLFFCTRDDNDC